MFGMSFPEIFVILALALVILGPEKLPEVARNVGKFLREMRKAGNSLRDAIMLEDELNEFKKNTRGISDALSTSPRDLLEDDTTDGVHDEFHHDDYAYHHGPTDQEFDDYHGNSMTYDPHAHDIVTQHAVELKPQRWPLEEAREVFLTSASPPSLSEPFEEALMAHTLEASPLSAARQVWLHDQLPHEAMF